MGWKTCSVCGTPCRGPRCHRHPTPNRTGRNGSTRAWRKLREQILERDGRVCFWCKTDGATHVDHLVPVAKGGTDDPTNLVASCASCNQRRGKSLDAPETTQGGPRDHKSEAKGDTALVPDVKNRRSAGMF